MTVRGPKPVTSGFTAWLTSLFGPVSDSSDLPQRVRQQIEEEQ